MKSRHSREAVPTMLIDPLEQRLLYSADHPLGLAVALDDDTGYQDDLQADHLTALVLAASIDQAEPEAPRAVAFVDTLVPDFAELSTRLEFQGIVVHAIDSTESGIDQVTNALSGYSELDSVMVFSHGVESGFLLGNDIVNSDFLSMVEPEIQAWGNALAADGDLLLFGCDVAKDEAGQAFLGKLAELTRADVAASDDTTGHVDRGGNWSLEWSSGAVNTTLLETTILDDWQGSLASIIVTTQDDLVDGDISSYDALQFDKGTDNQISLREAVLVANNDSSVSLISLSGGVPYELTEGELIMSGTYTLAGVSAIDTVIEQLDQARVIAVNLGNITLKDLTLTGGDTKVSENGGGLFINTAATAQLESVIIRDNLSGRHGAGIYNQGTLFAQDVRLTQNTATEHGGGIYNINTMTLNRVTIDSNTSIRDGGGIHQQGDGQSSTLDYVTISGNDAVRGGGISAKGEMIIRNSTITNNTAENDSAGLREHGLGTDTVSLYNTVLAGNTQSGGEAGEENLFGNATSLGFNFIGTDVSITLAASDIQGDDPEVTALELDSAGIIKTHVPTAGSPLINRGGSVSSTVDSTGAEIDTIPDIGAHEVQGSNGVLFWTDGISQIFRSDASGSYAQTLLSGLDPPLDLEVDATTGRIYWLEDGTYFLRSALPDGSDVQTHFTSNDSAVSFALNTSAGHVYIAEWNIPGLNVYSIRRYLMSDGSSEIISAAFRPTDLEFDVSKNTLHWLETSVPLLSTTSIDHLNLTTGVKTEQGIGAFTEISAESALVLNAAGERLYLADSNDPDPGILGVQDLTDLTLASVDTIPTATGIAFDSLNDRVIVTTGEDGRIFSFDADLGNSLELFSSAEEAGSIAYLAIQENAFQLIANTGATLDEGSSTTFSEATLLFEDDETDAISLIYTITTEPLEGEIQKSGVKVSTFTQEDIDEGLITYVNDDTHAGYESNWTDSFIFQLSNGASTFSNQIFTLTINDVDDPTQYGPLLSIVVDDASSVNFTNAEFQIVDVDTPDDQIVITTSNPSSGVLKYNGAIVTEFTLAELKSGGYLFEHDGSDASQPVGFDFTITSEGNTSATIPVTIGLRGTPLLEVNTGLTLDEGTSKEITSSELSYTDADTASSGIMYTASGLPAGAKLLVDSVEQLTFTQEDVDNGKVFYQDPDTHAGYNSSWTEGFDFVVSDGVSTSEIQTFELTVSDVPVTPAVLANIGLTLDEGTTKEITASELNHAIGDTPPSAITYTVSGLPAGGKLLVDSVEQLTFTQEDVDNGKVFYQDPDTHAGVGSSWTDNFEFVVSNGDDQSTLQTFELTISDVPVSPVVLANNGLTLDEGTTKEITASELNHAIGDTLPSAITYTVSGLPAGGKLLVDSVEQLTFTQEDVDNGKVFYQDPDTHAGVGSSWTDSFEFVVSNGDDESSIQTFELTISDVPVTPVVLANNGLTLDEGTTKEITVSELNHAIGDTPPSAITYTVSGLPAGGKLLVDSVEQLTFTQEDVDNGKVFYQDPDTHEGFESSWTDSFEFVVNDGDDSSAVQTFTLTIDNVPDAPVFKPAVGVSLQEGGRITLLPAHLMVTDVDTASEFIILTVIDPYTGQLIVDGVEKNDFSQADLIAGLVTFQHDGSEPSVEASVSFRVSDETTVLPADSLVFSIIPVHDEPPVANNQDLSGNRGDLMSRLQTGSLTLLDGVSDKDVPVGEHTVYLETDALHGMVSVNTDGTFSYQHDGSETFTDRFSFTIRDEGGNLSAPATVSISISGNTTPVTNGTIAANTATELQAFMLTLDADLFSDTADDSLLWQASLVDGSDLPQWLSFDSVSHTFSGTPGDIDTGRIELQVQAIDNQGAASKPLRFTLTVVDINQAPVLSVENQSTVKENQAGVPVSTVLVSDPDSADTVTVTVSDERFIIAGSQLSLKPGLSLDHESEAEILLTITASDESGETVDRWLPVQVQDANDIPVLLTDVQGIALQRETVTLIPADWFLDEDGDTLTYTWKMASGESVPEWIMFDQQGSSLMLGEVPENVSSQSVVLTASDGRGGVATLFLDLQIPPPILAPAGPVVEPVPVEPVPVEPVPVEPVPVEPVPVEPVPVEPTPVEPTPVEPTPEIVLSTLDLAEPPAGKSVANVTSQKDSLRADESAKSEEATSVAALGVSASGAIPLIVDMDPVSAEDLSDRIQNIRESRVISDQIGDAFQSRRINLSKPSATDVLHPTSNLNEMFSAVQRQDTQTLSELAREFEKQRQEMQSRENFNSAVVGSSITLSSGLSVGYLIYLVRGGAIVSSMLSSLPAWRFVDPLPILSSMDGGSDADGESLASIVSQDGAK